MLLASQLHLQSHCICDQLPAMSTQRLFATLGVAAGLVLFGGCDDGHEDDDHGHDKKAE